MRALLPVVALFIAGCDSDPSAGDYTTRRPDEASLAATYGFVGDASSPLSEACRLVLHADGTFSLSSYPASSLPSHLRFGGLTTATGQWQIDVAGPVSVVGKRTRAWGVGLWVPQTTNFLFGALTGQAPSYAIVFPRDGLGSQAVFAFQPRD